METHKSCDCLTPLQNKMISFYVSSLILMSFGCLRYASLYFCVAIEPDDNELITLEIVHRYVELLDKYFGSVSTLNY